MRTFHVLISFLSIANAWIHKAPIVFAPECQQLKQEISRASCGERFLLMTELSSNRTIRDNLRSLLQISIWMRYCMSVPIIQLDNTFTRCLTDCSENSKHHDDVVQSLNLARAFLQGGIGKISHHKDWTPRSSPEHLHKIVRFIETFDIRQPLTIDNYYVGHCVGCLDYEQQMTRNDSLSKNLYGCSSHFLWVKDLTDPQYVDYLCNIQNPIGVIVDDKTCIEHLLKIIPKLNPFNEQGKLTLMVKTRDIMSLVEKVQEHNVLWCSHASNLHSFLRLHKENKLNLGGIYLNDQQYGSTSILCRQWQPRLRVDRHNEDWNHFSL